MPADRRPPVDILLARAGGVRGLLQSVLPVAVFAGTNAVLGLQAAIAAAIGVAAVFLVWQVVRRGSMRPALVGFAGVAVCGVLALITGQAKDFYLPGIAMYLALAIGFTTSVVVRRPLVGVVWAWISGRDGTWRRVPRVRLAFDFATAVMATASWVRFLVQYHLYDTDQAGLLAAARVAMGWPIFLLTSTAVYLAIRTAVRALPHAA
ncbi:DUF3159 domain-containing protein [Mycobacterium neumannii]|uniref:DUF3159 domain-containing protein n=1 Tax=Mycobacterium neumannii TaxID=2048551 RepID=UPI003AB3B304